ncbi:MAG: hybrid sensor histidine kinase/response regulator, partial [Agrobacterium tumefaciens]
MAQMMRRHDWADSTLGCPDEWPEALKVAIRLLLTSKFEMWLGWGPDIAFFYNDAYRPTLGNKHPNALAVPTKILWSEIWNDIKGRLETVYSSGEATWDRALLLLLERDGYPEETYHTFSYSPLIGDSGKVEGVFCAVTEETERVISERRLATMRTLASGLAVADTEVEVFNASRKALNDNPQDLPFCALYVFDENGNAMRRWVCGTAEDDTLLPVTINRGVGIWNLERAWQEQAMDLIKLSATDVIPSGPWQRAPSQAAVIPLVGQASDQPKGVMITGLNPHRAVSD